MEEDAFAVAREATVIIILGIYSHDHAAMIQPFTPQAHVLSRYGPLLTQTPCLWSITRL